MSSFVDHHRREDAAQMRARALARQREEQRLRQAATLAQLDCLQGISQEKLLRLADLATLRVCLPGTVIQDEHASGEFLYLLLRGTVSLTLHDRAGREVLIGVLDRGDCFGEGLFFDNQFPGATVQAETSCYLLQIPLVEARTVLQTDSDLATLHMIYRRRLVESTLGRVPLFSQLSPLERAGVATLLQPHSYGRGQVIIHIGTAGDALYLIESGQVVVEQEGTTVAHLEAGDFFGEMSLLTSQPHNASIRTLTPVDVLALPAADFHQLLNIQPALEAQLREVAERRRITGTAMRSDRSRLHQLNVAVDRGMLRGTHVLVRDPQRCDPDCHLCEQACALRHGKSRIHSQGVLFGELGLAVTDTCRQCRFGAECVEACPTNAIEWNNRGALIVNERCDGCAACVEACPYDAVQLVPHHQRKISHLHLIWQQIKRFPSFSIPLEPVGLAHRADKCDLCHGFDDLACVSACPNGALRLVPVEELFPL